jgi:hypothetical protein
VIGAIDFSDAPVFDVETPESRRKTRRRGKIKTKTGTRTRGKEIEPG